MRHGGFGRTFFKIIDPAFAALEHRCAACGVASQRPDHIGYTSMPRRSAVAVVPLPRLRSVWHSDIRRDFRA
jgi:hypothetical protein